MAGRAYVDIWLGDTLETTSVGGEQIRVVGVVTYRKTLVLLSTMMTGTLTVEGDLQKHPTTLYVRR